MELVWTLLALIAWHGVVDVPASGAVVGPMAGRRGMLVAGGGRRWLPPWPLQPPVALPGLPFEAREDSLVTRERPARHALRGGERRVDLSGPVLVEATGNHLRVAGRRLLTLPFADHARLMAARVTELVETPSSARAPLAERWLEASLDVDAARVAVDELRRASRALRWAATLQLLVLVVALPSAVWALGTEAALRTLLPVLVGLHAMATAALAWAVYRLPAPRGGRLELLGLAALYPPALLHAPAELGSRHLARLHPLAVAAALLPEARWRPALQRALARAEASEAPAALEPALLRLASALGLAESELRAPPTPLSPLDARYCPVCRDAYRESGRHCADCGVATRPLSAA